MKELFDKLSTYNIFNCLLPGVVFVVLAEALTSFSFIQQDILIGVFLYYFIGLVISRVGSIIIEPLLKRVKFVRFAKYSDFVSASKKDDTLEILSEVNNMYRTLCSLFVLLMILKGYEEFVAVRPCIAEWNTEVLTLGLFLLFGFSYRKQTQYIVNRVRSTLEKGE